VKDLIPFLRQLDGRGIHASGGDGPREPHDNLKAQTSPSHVHPPIVLACQRARHSRHLAGHALIAKLCLAGDERLPHHPLFASVRLGRTRQSALLEKPTSASQELGRICIVWTQSELVPSVACNSSLLGHLRVAGVPSNTLNTS
jgi:hypothetical protein